MTTSYESDPALADVARGPRTGGPDAARRPTRIEPSSGWFPGVRWRELWDYRELALILALRDLQVRYKQTVFGVGWAILQPLAGVAIFTFVFGRVAGLQGGSIPYPVFVFIGLIVWSYFSTAANEASRVLVSNPQLVTKVYFPRLLAPFSSLLPPLVDLAVMAAALAVFLIAYGVAPTVYALLAPLFLLLMIVTTLGVSLVLAAMNVQYRDVGRALQFVLQVCFFATPVVYATSLFTGLSRYLLALNPLSASIDGLRWGLAGGPAPAPGPLAVSIASAAVICVGGVVYFRRTERRFADVI